MMYLGHLWAQCVLRVSASFIVLSGRMSFRTTECTLLEYKQAESTAQTRTNVHLECAEILF